LATQWREARKLEKNVKSFHSLYIKLGALQKSPGGVVVDCFCAIDICHDLRPTTPKILTGSRLAIRIIRNGFLGTCQAIGFSGTNGVYNGNQFGTNVDRTGVQWLKLGVDAANGSLSYSAHGRVYDPKPNNPL
jgi:hypothetical protein